MMGYFFTLQPLVIRSLCFLAWAPPPAALRFYWVVWGHHYHCCLHHPAIARRMYPWMSYSDRDKMQVLNTSNFIKGRLLLPQQPGPMYTQYTHSASPQTLSSFCSTQNAKETSPKGRELSQQQCLESSGADFQAGLLPAPPQHDEVHKRVFGV